MSCISFLAWLYASRIENMQYLPLFEELFLHSSFCLWMIYIFPSTEPEKNNNEITVKTLDLVQLFKAWFKVCFFRHCKELVHETLRAL